MSGKSYERVRWLIEFLENLEAQGFIDVPPVDEFDRMVREYLVALGVCRFIKEDEMWVGLIDEDRVVVFRRIIEKLFEEEKK